MSKRTLIENQDAITNCQREDQNITIVTEGTYNKKIKDWELNNELCDHPTWWISNLDTVINGKSGCPKCCVEKRALSKRLSIQDLRSRLEGRNIIMVNYGGGTNAPNTEFECITCNYRWKTSFSSVAAGSGCPRCSNIARLTEDEVTERLKGKPIRMIKYSGLIGQKKSEFECLNCHLLWSSTVNNIFNGKGCPSCAKTGFNPTKPAWVYVFLIDTPKGYCYGFGITNVLKSRIKTHKKNLGSMLDYEYPPIYFDSGAEAKLTEAEWKSSPHLVDIGVDGFRTECVLVNLETTKMIFG